MQLRSSTGQVYTLQPVNTTLGQNPQNDIVIREAGILGTHLDITQGEQGVYITPRQPGPGTLLNGQPLYEARYITPNDVIQVGPHTFQLVPAAAQTLSSQGYGARPGQPPMQAPPGPQPPLGQQPPYGQQPPFGQPQPPPGYAPSPRGYAPQAATFGAAASVPSSQIKNVIGVGLVLLGLAVLIGFAALPWFRVSEERARENIRETLQNSDLTADMSDDEIDSTVDQFVAAWSETSEDCSVQAYKVATDFSICGDEEVEDTYPGSIKTLHYALFILPALAVILMLTGLAQFLSQRVNKPALAVALVVALILLVFPFLWARQFNNEYWDYSTELVLQGSDYDSLDDLTAEDRASVELQADLVIDVIETGWRYVWLIVMSIVALLVALGGLALAMMRRPQPVVAPYPPGYGGYR